MGIKNLFKKKPDPNFTKSLDFYAPITGNLLPIEAVPDPVFSEKMMGDGFAIEPTEGKIYSPISGKVLNIFPTKHAIGLQTNEGYEILIHVGMDTVTLNGEGFRAHVKEGATILSGSLLLEVDIELVSAKVPTLITPIVFTNLAGKTIKLKKTGMLVHGEKDILEIRDYEK